MLRAAIACVFAVAMPALASGEECWFVDKYGAIARFVNPLEIEIVDPTLGVITCATYSGGTGILTRGVNCSNGHSGVVFSAPSTLGGEQHDLLIFHNDVWYRQCD